MPNPANTKLYEKIKTQVKQKVSTWPSIYASSLLVSEYKKAGGKYIGKKPVDTGLTRWYKEKWIDVCFWPKIKNCGRNDMKTKYPKCRPLYKISKKTPKTVTEIIKEKNKKFLKRMCTHKRKHGLPKQKKSTRTKLQKN